MWERGSINGPVVREQKYRPLRSPRAVEVRYRGPALNDRVGGPVFRGSARIAIGVVER